MVPVGLTCPRCGRPDLLRPEPEQPVTSTGPLEALSRLTPQWLAGLLGLLVLCCAGPYLLSSLISGSVTRALITLPVLAVFVAAVIVDRRLNADSGASPPPWQCRLCGYTPPPPGPPSRLRARLLAVARIAVTVILPWKPAAFLFAPRHRLAPEDRMVALLSRIRVVLGLAIVVGVALWYRSYGRLEPVSFIESWLVSGLLAIPSCLICMALVVAATGRSARRATIRQLRWPALSLLAFVATIALLALFGKGAGYVSGRVDFLLRSNGIPGIPLDGVVYGGVFGLWLLVFCIRSAYLVTQNWFNAVDGHLLLAPLIATWMAWLVVVKTLAFDGGTTERVPDAVSLVLILGGASATTGIAALEAWRTIRQS